MVDFPCSDRVDISVNLHSHVVLMLFNKKKAINDIKQEFGIQKGK